jgi:hypothetical protein
MALVQVVDKDARTVLYRLVERLIGYIGIDDAILLTDLIKVEHGKKQRSKRRRVLQVNNKTTKKGNKKLKTKNKATRKV